MFFYQVRRENNSCLCAYMGKSSEAAMSRYATAENFTQRKFHQHFSSFTQKMRFWQTGYALEAVPFKPH